MGELLHVCEINRGDGGRCRGGGEVKGRCRGGAGEGEVKGRCRGGEMGR